MTRLNDTLVDEIVRRCMNEYEKLSKSGKPVCGEWTVLSCVVVVEGGGGRCAVAALGTGSKCVGAGALCPRGARLHDSHAEVVARRGFLLYLYDNIDNAIRNRPSIFQRTGNAFTLKPDIEFAFYSSQLPCGDASIFPKNHNEELYGDLLQSNKRHAAENICESSSKLIQLEKDIHRTGAKCLADSIQDPKLPGLQYHIVGQVRTKPGRGDRTLSVSCSDKIARWVHVGIQGALLDTLCGPIYIKHFIFGGGVPYSEYSLKRALFFRKNNSTIHAIIDPELYQSSIEFSHRRTESRLRPAPGSIIWISTNCVSEVAVQGKKLGLTKKQADLPKHSVCISKSKLYERYIRILIENKDIQSVILKDLCPRTIPYNNMKLMCKKYNDNWREVKEKLFGSWTKKPDMWNFCITSDP